MVFLYTVDELQYVYFTLRMSQHCSSSASCVYMCHDSLTVVALDNLIIKINYILDFKVDYTLALYLVTFYT